MVRRIVVAFCLILTIVISTGCGNRNNEVSTDISIDEENVEETEKPKKAEGQTNPPSTKELEPPRTKEELEEALGTINEEGNWTPPEGSYIDPKTGNILNKDGVVVGTTQKPYTKARPGSQG